MLLRQLIFSYSAFGSITKNKDQIQKFKETDDSTYIYQNELDKACLQQEMAYTDLQDFATRTASDKVLLEKALEIVSDPKHDEYIHELLQRSGNFLIKNLLVVEQNLLLGLN